MHGCGWYFGSTTERKPKDLKRMCISRQSVTLRSKTEARDQLCSRETKRRCSSDSGREAKLKVLTLQSEQILQNGVRGSTQQLLCGHFRLRAGWQMPAVGPDGCACVCVQLLAAIGGVKIQTINKLRT